MERSQAEAEVALAEAWSVDSKRYTIVQESPGPLRPGGSAVLVSTNRKNACRRHGCGYKFRHPMGVACVPVPSIYDLTKLCQKFLVLLLSFSNMSQAIKETI